MDFVYGPFFSAENLSVFEARGSIVLGCDSSAKGSSLLEFNEAGLQIRKYELLPRSFH